MYLQILLAADFRSNRMMSQTEWSLLSGFRSPRRERILDVDGTLTTQPVLEHVGISTWPGAFSSHYVCIFESMPVSCSRTLCLSLVLLYLFFCSRFFFFCDMHNPNKSHILCRKINIDRPCSLPWSIESCDLWQGKSIWPCRWFKTSHPTWTYWAMGFTPFWQGSYVQIHILVSFFVYHKYWKFSFHQLVGVLWHCGVALRGYCDELLSLMRSYMSFVGQNQSSWSFLSLQAILVVTIG